MAVRRDSDCGLIVLGMQNDLVQPDGFFGRAGLVRVGRAELRGVIENINSLAARFRESGRPVFHGCWQLRPYTSTRPTLSSGGGSACARAGRWCAEAGVRSCTPTWWWKKTTSCCR